MWENYLLKTENNLAFKHSIYYFETSAKLNIKTEELFPFTVRMILELKHFDIFKFSIFPYIKYVNYLINNFFCIKSKNIAID